jgi:hypothetical protein
MAVTADTKANSNRRKQSQLVSGSRYETVLETKRTACALFGTRIVRRLVLSGIVRAKLQAHGMRRNVVVLPALPHALPATALTGNSVVADARVSDANP